MHTKQRKFDRVLTDFFRRNLNLFFVVGISLLTLVIRNEFRGWQSGDYLLHLLPWAEYLESHGGFAGIASGPPNCDYPVTYQYILAFLTYLPGSYLAKLKVVSVFFDFVSAAFVMLIVREIGGYSKKSYIPWLAYALTLLIPTPILNSAAWAQSDSIYTAFLVITLYFLIREKYPQAFIAFGLAFSFKLQAVFFFPVFLLLYLKNRKFSLLHFLIIPAVVAVLSLPALIMGKPPAEIFSVYIGQIQSYQKTTLNFPNMYFFLPDLHWQFAVPGILLTVALILTLYYLLLKRERVVLMGGTLLEVSLLTIMICAYCLPSMHQRYLFTGDILAVIYLFTRRERPYIPLLIWLISVNGYLWYLYGFGPLVEQRYLAMAYLWLMVLIARDLVFQPLNTLQTLKEDNTPDSA